MFQAKAAFTGVSDIGHTREKEKLICGGGNNSSEGQMCTFRIGTMRVNFYLIQSVMSETMSTVLNMPADLVVLNVGSHYVFE